MDRDTYELLAAAALAILVTRGLYKLVKPWLGRSAGETLADRAAALEELRRSRAGAYFRMFGSVPTTLAALVLFFLSGFGLLHATIHAPVLAGSVLFYIAIGVPISGPFAKNARPASYVLLDNGAKVTYRLVYACLWPLILLLKSK